jgi:ParB family chromosome partitioning protein
MSQFYNNSVFWIEVDKIKPNPFQPRREFDQAQLQSLSDSIRQYGVLQALVVTRKEVQTEDGGLATEYELIAGERRLRAAKLAGVREVPVLIREGEDDDLMKLELAIIENLQREDLNPVERAKAFKKLAEEFKLTHAKIGEKVGKSRVYVTNTIRLLDLPEPIIQALSEGKITEGHMRPLGMLASRPDEQMTVFKEIMFKKLTVRDTEKIARKIAYDRVRKKDLMGDPELVELENKLSESLGTRVQIDRKEKGGRLFIDFFSNDDLWHILEMVRASGVHDANAMLNQHIAKQQASTPVESTSTSEPLPVEEGSGASEGEPLVSAKNVFESDPHEVPEMDDRAPEEKKAEENIEEDLYSVKNFTV